MHRTCFVISDLHLGGEWGDDPGTRGFRINTRPDALAAFVRHVADRPTPAELIINGDFVDFLAEQRGERWSSFEHDPAAAVATFERLAARPGRKATAAAGGDAAVFDALADLVAARQGLTVVLGNHDLELALPAVRRAFLRRIRATERQVRFVLDDEALVIGDALIEHGNRADDYNRVDHLALGRLRADQSRGIVRPGPVFAPPPGSRVVAEVMNDLKVDLPFIDLLKPEGAALYALLLAIDPQVKSRLTKMVPIVTRALVGKSYAQVPALGPLGAKMSGGGDPEDGEAALLSAIDAALNDPAAHQAAAELLATLTGADASGRSATVIGPAGKAMGTGGLGLATSFFGLLFGDASAPLTRRLRLLQPAIARLSDDISFARDQIDPEAPYYDAAIELANAGHRYVVLGHTHHAKQVPIGNLGTYLNTGTWADVMRFPSDLLLEGQAGVDALRSFFTDVKAGRLDPYVQFQPTYARLEVGADGRIEEGVIEDWPADPT